MGVVNTQYTFAANDVITSTKMNDIIDQTTVTDDAILGNTLEVAGGKLKIRSQGVTSNEIASNAVTTTKVLNGAITPEKLSTGSPYWGPAGGVTVSNVVYLANDGFRFASDGAVDTGMSWNGDGEMNVICNAQVVGRFNSTGWTGASGSAYYATRAGNGPENNIFIQSHTANVTKMYIGGFGVNKGAGLQCQRYANEGATAISFTKETGEVVGSITLDVANSTNYLTTSDYRLKEDLVLISDGLLKVNLLKPTNFKWVDIDARIDGFIAHEVKSVVPNAVSGEKDAVDENNDPVYQQIDASKLIPIMVAAIQELSQKVAELESR